MGVVFVLTPRLSLDQATAKQFGVAWSDDALLTAWSVRGDVRVQRRARVL